MEGQMELKFLELKQNNLCVMEYEAKFTELSRFVPELVSTEEKKARRLQQGLRQWIQNRIAVLELTDYATVVQKATIVEARSKQSQEEKEGRRKRKFVNQWGSSASGNFQQNIRRKQEFQTGRESILNRAESEKFVHGSWQTGEMKSVTSKPPLPDWKTCGKKHTGMCLRGEKKCFKCGKEGHFIVQCTGGSSGPKPSFSYFKC